MSDGGRSTRLEFTNEDATAVLAKLADRRMLYVALREVMLARHNHGKLTSQELVELITGMAADALGYEWDDERKRWAEAPVKWLRWRNVIDIGPADY